MALDCRESSAIRTRRRRDQSQEGAVRLEDLLQSHSNPEAHKPDSLPGRILPPDPTPPARPTIPPPTCGTLPPTVSSVIDLLGGLGKFGR